MRLSYFLLGLVALGVFVAAGASVVYIKRRNEEARRRAERAPGVALMTIASAQADFRSNDRDLNGVNDFWTADVASLYYLNYGGGLLKTIEKVVADADASPVKGGQIPPVPHHGYLFRAMEKDASDPGGPQDYRTDTGGSKPMGKVHHLSQFGVCAYPAVYGEAAKWTYILSEYNVIWKSDTGGVPMTAWPTEEALRKPWVRFDPRFESP